MNPTTLRCAIGGSLLFCGVLGIAVAYFVPWVWLKIGCTTIAALAWLNIIGLGLWSLLDKFTREPK
jgi:hypothetical protein